MRTIALIIGLVVCVGVVGCGNEHPEIFIGQNVFNLNSGNALISGEQDQESFCPVNGCPQTTRVCWNNDGHLLYGYCRECDDVTAPQYPCGNGLSCDHGWCHTGGCSASSECESTEFCTDGFCRKPDTVDVAIYNIGSRILEIDKDNTKIYGNSDACAFYRLAWPDNGTAGPIKLSKGEFTNLRINFTPTDTTTIYRAYVLIYSNDPNLNPLPLLLCGQGAEGTCSEAPNGVCLDRPPSCKQEDFTAIMNTEAVCTDLK
jgi:hypothetical protein